MWGHSLLILEGNNTVEAAHHVPYWVKKLPIVMGVLGLVLGWVFYNRFTNLPSLSTKIFKPLHALFFNKWFFDELYNKIFIKPAFGLVVCSGREDKNVFDGLGPDGVAKTSLNIAGLLSRFQSGYIFHYAFVMMIGLMDW